MASLSLAILSAVALYFGLTEVGSNREDNRRS